jgi:hypothetical protein
VVRVRRRSAVAASAIDRPGFRVVADARGRVRAMDTLRRRVPALSHAQIIEYMTALQHGDAPAHLVQAVSTELIPPVDPVVSVVTRRRAEHRGRA